MQIGVDANGINTCQGAESMERTGGDQYSLNRRDAFSFSTLAISSSHFLFNSISPGEEKVISKVD